MLILSTWDAWKKFKIEPIYFPAPMNVNLINPVFPHLWSAGREYIYSWKSISSKKSGDSKNDDEGSN